MPIKKRETIFGTKRETTIVRAAEIVEQYLDTYSLARNIIKVDSLNGSMPNYGISEDMTLDDISILTSGFTGKEVITGSHLAAHGQGASFWLPTWEFAVWSDNLTGKEDIEERLLKKIKLAMLREEESIFIDFVKQVTKNNSRYIVCKNNIEAIGEINKIGYKRIWVGKDIEIDISDLEKIRSSHLKGIILAHSCIPDEVGIFAVRQQPTILNTCELDKIVSFEEQSMMVVNKELTYIEIENE